MCVCVTEISRDVKIKSSENLSERDEFERWHKGVEKTISVREVQKREDAERGPYVREEQRDHRERREVERETVQ